MRQPPCCLDHENATAINHAQSENNWGSARASGSFHQKPLFLEACLRMNGNWKAVQPAGRRMFDGRRAFHVRERYENEPTNSGIQARLQEIPEPSHIGLRKKPLRSRGKEYTSEVNRDVNS